MWSFIETEEKWLWDDMQCSKTYEFLVSVI